MAIYSVDVYSGSSDSIIRDPHAQAVIVKATQGTGYVNPLCNHQWDLAGSLGKLRGLYHYAGGGNPENEAQYFINNIKNYVGQGILILDWESYQNASWGDTTWCLRFVKEVHRLTGVYPLLYVQESAVWQVANCAALCGLWGAKYASMNWNSWAVPNMGFATGAFKFLTGWQFTGGDMDRSVWYLDAAGWNRLAQPNAEVKTVAKSGSLDSVRFDDDQVAFSGWFADDNATGKPYRYVILTDRNGHELGRAKADSAKRPDVLKVFPKLNGAEDSGFTAHMKYTPAMAGQKVEIIFRYTDDPAGNGNYVDFTFDYAFNKSAAYLDGKVGSVIFSNKLTAAGWFANDASVMLDKRFIILYDHTANREIERLKVQPVKRDDVAKAHPDIYGAGAAGFVGTFDYSVDLAGHDLQIIMRYSDADNGEGRRVDYWFNSFKGPMIPVVDGKTETSILVHSFTAESKDNKIQLTFK